MFIAAAYILGYALGADIIILFGTTYAILTVYITVLLYLRKSYFPFIDEEKEVYKRKSFKDFDKNIYDIHLLDAHRDEFYGDKFLWDYLGVNFTNIIFNGGLSSFILLAMLYNDWRLAFSIIPLIIFMHSTLFPDYINKILPSDIRTHKGFRIYYLIWCTLVVIPILVLKLLVA